MMRNMFKVFMLLVFMAGLNGCGNEYKNEALDKRFVFETFKYGNREGRYIALYDKGEITVIDRSENYDHELVMEPRFIDENRIAYTWDSNIFIYNIKEKKKERKISLFKDGGLRGYGFVNNNTELIAAGRIQENGVNYIVLLEYDLESKGITLLKKWIENNYSLTVFTVSRDKKYVYMDNETTKESCTKFIVYDVDAGKIEEFETQKWATEAKSVGNRYLVTTIIGDLSLYDLKNKTHKTIEENGVVVGPFSEYSKNEVAYRTDDEDWAIINIETGKKRNFRKIYGVPEKGYILYDVDFYFPETDKK